MDPSLRFGISEKSNPIPAIPRDYGRLRRYSSISDHPIPHSGITRDHLI